MAGGMSTLLHLRHGICNQAEHIGRDLHPSAHSAKAPFPLRSLMAPHCLRLTWIPTPGSFLGSQEKNEHQRTVVSQRKGSTFLQGSKKWEEECYSGLKVCTTQRLAV